MASEEDLLEDAYYRECGVGDLEDLDADAEDALLGDSDEETRGSGLHNANKEGEIIEYVDEEGNPVEIGENDEVEYVEYEEATSVSENLDYSDTPIEEVDDVLDLAVDQDLEFDDSATLTESSEAEGPNRSRSSYVAQQSESRKSEKKDNKTIESDSGRSLHGIRRQEVLKDIDDNKRSNLSELPADSSESESEEPSGRGRFHSERPNIIHLTVAKKRTNIPDTLDDILQNNESSRSDRGKDRKSRNRNRSQAEHRGKDRDRSARSSQRSSLSPPRRSQNETKRTSSTERDSAASSRYREAQSNTEPQGPRKILINPHFKGGFANTSSASALTSSWAADLPASSLFPRQPMTEEVIQTKLHHQPPPLNNLMSLPPPSHGNVLQPMRPTFPFDPMQPPPPRVSIAPALATVPPPPLPDFRHRLPPPVLSVVNSSNVPSILGPPPISYPPREAPPLLIGNQTQQVQPWAQNLQTSVSVQPPQIPGDQYNTWGNHQPSLRPFTAPLSHPQRWSHPPPAVMSSPANLSPFSSVAPRPASMPDIRRPPPRPLGQLSQQPTFSAPPPLFRFDTPPPVKVGLGTWQNRDQRMLGKPLLSPLPTGFSNPPPIFGNVRPKLPILNAVNQLVPVHLEQKKFNPSNVLPPQLRSLGPNSHQRFQPHLQQQQQASWQIQILRSPTASGHFATNKRPLLHGMTSSPKIAKSFDSYKQVVRRKTFPVNSNIKEVTLVDNLPELSGNSDKPLEVSGDSKANAIVEEDEETRRYREQIELQKKKREEIVRIKEQRRKIMALQRRKQMIQQQQKLSQAAFANSVINVITGVAATPQKANKKLTLPHGTLAVKQLHPPPNQASSNLKKRVVVIRKISPVSGQPRFTDLAKSNQSALLDVLDKQNVVTSKSSADISGSANVVSSSRCGGGPATQTAPTAKRFMRSVMPDTQETLSVVSDKFPKPQGSTQITNNAKQQQQQPQGNTKPVARRLVVVSQKTVTLNQQKRSVVCGSSASPAKKLTQQQQQRQVVTVQGKQQQQQAQRVIVAKSSNTKTVLIENLALSTSEGQVRKLCQTIGPIEVVKLNKDQRKAVVTFKSPQNAVEFMDKYQRKMVDLSLISISMTT